MPDPIIVTKQLLEETYDAAALSYDNIWLFKECGQRLIGHLPMDPGANVLDIATGTGMVLIPAARRVGPVGHVTGIDISANMLQQAKKAVLENKLSNIDLLKMDAEHLKFPDTSFDAITCGWAIFHMPPTAVQEMYRVCKPGGYIGVSHGERTAPEAGSPGAIFTQLAKDYNMEIKYPQQAGFLPKEIEVLFTDFGFNLMNTFRETKERIYASVEEYWEALPPGNQTVLTAMDDAARARFKKDYLTRLRSAMRPDGIHHIVHVIYSVAQK